MTTTASTWRDLAGQLTPQQVTYMEALEAGGADGSPDAYRQWLIGEAREHIAGNQRDADLNTRIRPPAGATSVGGWDSLNATGRLSRSVLWASVGSGATTVDVDGWQDETGAVDGPHVSLYGLAEGAHLGADAARAFTTAAAVLAL